MSVAAAGVVMNGVIAALLWKFSGDAHIRSCFCTCWAIRLDCGSDRRAARRLRLTGLQWIDPC